MFLLLSECRRIWFFSKSKMNPTQLHMVAFLYRTQKACSLIVWASSSFGYKFCAFLVLTFINKKKLCLFVWFHVWVWMIPMYTFKAIPSHRCLFNRGYVRQMAPKDWKNSEGSTLTFPARFASSTLQLSKSSTIIDL